jgi:hypothetical protein
MAASKSEMKVLYSIEPRSSGGWRHHADKKRLQRAMKKAVQEERKQHDDLYLCVELRRTMHGQA